MRLSGRFCWYFLTQGKDIWCNLSMSFFLLFLISGVQPRLYTKSSMSTFFYLLFVNFPAGIALIANGCVSENIFGNIHK